VLHFSKRGFLHEFNEWVGKHLIFDEHFQRNDYLHLSDGVLFCAAFV